MPVVKPTTPDDVFQAYGVPKYGTQLAEALQKLDPELLKVAVALAPDWAPILVPNKNPKVVLDFCTFLASLGNRYPVILPALERINEVLVVLDDPVKGSKLKDPIRSLDVLITDTRWTLFSKAISDLEATKLLHLKQYLQKRKRETHVSSLENFYFLCCAPQVGHGELALDAIALVMEKDGYHDYINDETICGLALMTRFKVRTDFHGYPGWGPGDHGDPATNLEGHFEKHCLGIGNSPTLQAWEMCEWWTTFDLKLSLAEYNNNTLNKKAAAQQLFTQDGSLPKANFLKLAELDPITGEANFVILLKGKMMSAYRDFAIAQSQNLTDVLIHGNEKRVFLSGCIRATSLIIFGRYEGSTLGISSAYFVPPGNMDKKLTDRLKFWPLI
jgi:hypothetical protein